MNLYRYFTTTIMPWDLWRRGISKKRSGVKVGWCSPFPPAPNGAAAATYFSVKELVKNQEIDLYGIPLNGFFDKKKFAELGLARLGDSRLDAIIFFGLGLLIGPALRRTRTISIAWQTIHYGPNRFAPERDLTEQLKGADLLISLSRWAQKEYLRYGVERAEYIPHGVDTSVFKPRGKKNTRPEILFVGRLNYSKGINVFLEMIPFVLAKFPECLFRLHAPWDIHSQYLNEMEEAIKEIRRKYPDNFIHEEKWIDYFEVSKCYENADVLVFPSNNEGFGLPLIEAMACEIPCIVADSPPMNELVLDGKTGFCIPFNQKNSVRYHNAPFPDPEEIADKIIYLLGNEKERCDMGRAARKHVQTEYELSICMSKMVNYVKELLRGQK